MRKAIAACVVAATWLAAAGAPRALAIDVPTSYTVDQKALATASASSTLAFELYTDAGCTALAYRDSVALVDVELIVRLKLAKTRGGPMPPKMAELRHTIRGVGAASAFYLKVTGPGVLPMPMDAVCQAQPAGVPGPTGAPGVIGGIFAKDANGVTIGPILYGDYTRQYVLHPVGDKVVALEINGGSLGGVEGTLWYETIDCTGQGWMQSDAPSGGLIESFTTVVDGVLYFPSGPVTTVHLLAEGSPGQCYPNPYVGTIDMLPAATEDLRKFVPPFRAVAQLP